MTTTTAQSIRWRFRDGLTIAQRNLQQVRRQPAEIVGALIFPAVMVLLFGYVFGSAISIPGGGNYREYLMPGLFAMTALTAIMATTMSMATDASTGVMNRFRSMPVSRTAIPFGQTGADIVLGIVATAIMTACALAVGWRAHHGFLDTAAGFGLLLLFRYAMSWAGVYLGLAVKSEKTADNLVPLTLPVGMLGNTYVPTDGMPAWLRVVCDWNPVSAVAASCRKLFGNPGTDIGHHALPLDHPVLATLIWSAGLLLIFVPLSTRAFLRAER